MHHKNNKHELSYDGLKGFHRVQKQVKPLFLYFCSLLTVILTFSVVCFLRWYCGIRTSWRNRIPESNADLGFPVGTSGKVPACQCKRYKSHEFDPWIGKMHWRRKWQPTPLFLSGNSHEQRSLAGCSLWGPKTVEYDLASEIQQQVFYHQ